MDFKESLNRLEEIVNILEDSDISLEESVEVYEEGMRLSKLCQDKLIDAERKVYILKEGKLDKKPKKSKRGRKKKKIEEDEELIIEKDFELFKE